MHPSQKFAFDVGITFLQYIEYIVSIERNFYKAIQSRYK